MKTQTAKPGACLVTLEGEAVLNVTDGNTYDFAKFVDIYRERTMFS